MLQDMTGTVAEDHNYSIPIINYSSRQSYQFQDIASNGKSFCHLTTTKTREIIAWSDRRSHGQTEGENLRRFAN